jgi:plasmid stability protein
MLQPRANCATQFHVKNVTIALDDETHRKARVRAAELGTSLSALVKNYLISLVEDSEAPSSGVREMRVGHKAASQQADGPPWFINGEWSYTPDGKPRQPGSLRHMAASLDKLLEIEIPDDVFEAMEHWDENDFDPLP